MGDHGKKSLSFEGAVDLQQAISYLEGLAAALRAGTVTLELEGDAVSMRPSRTISFSIEAKRKKERERISLELSWSREREAVAPGLTIHDREVSPFPDYSDDEYRDESSEPLGATLGTGDPAANGATPTIALKNSDDVDSADEEDDDDRYEKKKKKKK